MKILISGYYGFGNAGDSLVLDSILGQIRARDGKADITVLSASPAYTAPVHNVKSVYRWNWIKIFTELRKCDVLISGGGGLFQDYTGNIGLYYYLGIIYLAKLLKKKVFICAVGINELKKINSAITSKVLRLADKITVREQDSQELLVKWGCPREKIEVTADPVLCNEYRQRFLSKESPRIAIILRPR